MVIRAIMEAVETTTVVTITEVVTLAEVTTIAEVAAILGEMEVGILVVEATGNLYGR
jgi:hypothetical protein